ncbi:MAG: hypothetical protein RMZ43_002905 [Nostoc sp. CmiVER01]|nr:hypothetical protein [Nostoc sp. CmiVER01]
MKSDDRTANLVSFSLYYLIALSLITSFKYHFSVGLFSFLICYMLISIFYNSIMGFLAGTPIGVNNTTPIIKNDTNLYIFVVRACLLWVVLNILYVLGLQLHFSIMFYFGDVLGSFLILIIYLSPIYLLPRYGKNI